MAFAKKQSQLTEKEYLEGEKSSETKHELIDGYAYAMAGASANHERISGNIYRELSVHLKNSSCEPFGSDMKVKIGSNYFYPDVIVDCEFDESQPYYTDSPVIIVEVLSKSTRRIDETTKRLSYVNIPSLQEYMLIEQDFVNIEVVRKTDGWLSTHYFLGDKIILDSINLTLSVEEIYHRVKNEDMLEFVAAKNKSTAI